MVRDETRGVIIMSEPVKRRRGRPVGSTRPSKPGRTRNRTVALSDDQYALFLARGGSAWLRDILKVETSS